jgi:histidine ammonia-lyase
MCAAQGLDCRLPLKPGKKLVDAHATVRNHIPSLGQDRVLSPDIETISKAIAAGEFAGSV